jgi:hypothetical protein
MAVLVLVAVPVVASPASAQVLRPPDHPNHYIILLDGSGSTIENASKQETYLRVIRNILPAHLFHSGFGDSVPAVDPVQDVVTVERFGIFEGETSQVFGELPRADFLNHYIHLLGSPTAHLTEEQFAALMASSVPHYRYTVLSWCKELGLSNVKRYINAQTFGRTFLVVVDDGLTNGADGRHEVAEIEQWGNPTIVQETEAVVDAITSQYKFVSAKAGPGGNFQLRSGTGKNLIFVESYEVVPKSLLEWQAEAARMLPFSDFQAKWALRSAQLRLRGSFSPEFRSWATAGGAHDVQLTTDSQSQTISLDGSSFNLPLARTRSCKTQSSETEIRASLLQRDPTLGERPLIFAYRYSFSEPKPMECTALGYAQLSVALLISVAIAGMAGVVVFFRLVALPATLRMPGHRAVWLKRSGIANVRTDNSPRPGAAAFELRLPPRFLRIILAPHLTLQIGNPRSSERGTSSLELAGGEQFISVASFPGDRITAVWTLTAAMPTGAMIVLADAKRSVTVNLLNSRRTLTMPVENPNSTSAQASRRQPVDAANLLSASNRTTHLVALDLGSESMAAYYRVVRGGQEQRGIINLQHYSDKLLKDGKPQLFKEDGRISPRLRTRFSLRDNRDEMVQPNLSFVRAGKPNTDECDKSVFEFFRPEGRSLSKLMPNPKIIFQRGAQKAIPEVVPANSNEEKSLRPDEVIGWLTAQVLNNLVLESPELRAVPRDRIELILTVPNVYSVTHVESLRRFVAEHTKVAAVQTIFESDAIAAFAIDASENAKGVTHSGDSFYREFSKALKRHIPIEIVTFDMGRGTTDLSVVAFEDPASGTRDGNPGLRNWQHFQKGRTGRSDGGNKLTYLFVQCFETTVAAAFASAHAERIYSFKGRVGKLPPPEQMIGLQFLEEYVEVIKEKVSTDYRLNERDDEIKRTRESVVDKIAGENPSKELRQLLSRALALPPRLRNSLYRSLLSKGKQFLLKIGKNQFELQRYRAHDELVRALDNYVENNVTKPVTDLKAMAEEYEAHYKAAEQPSSSPLLGSVAHSVRRFAVIAGQAAQFRPIERKIIQVLGDKLRIGDSRIQFLRKGEAKECCCRGAVAFYANAIDAMNEDHLHGTFGVAGGMQIRPEYIPVWNLGDQGYEKMLAPGAHRFMFSPKPLRNTKDLTEMDDSWTTLCTFNSTRMIVQYDTNKRELKLNGEPIVLEPFGDLELEELYAQLWPEFLPDSVAFQSSDPRTSTR